MEKSKKTIKVSDIFNRYGMILILIGLLVVCSFLSNVFLTSGNLMNILRQVSTNGIVSLGMMLVIITGGIDLSVASVVACGSLLMAGLQTSNPIFIILVVVLFGVITGFVNGVFVARFGLQAFIVTLGTMQVFRGVGLTYSGGSYISGVNPALKFIGQGKIFGMIPISGIIFIILAIIIGIMLKYSKLGRYTYAIGGNETASRLSGINTKKYKTLIYIICGVMAAISGIIMSAHLNVGEPNIATSIEMDDIAACVIGGTSLAGGKGSAMGTVIGVFIIGIFGNLLNLLNIPGYSQPIFKGAIIVGAALLQTFQEKRA